MFVFTFACWKILYDLACEKAKEFCKFVYYYNQVRIDHVYEFLSVTEGDEPLKHEATSDYLPKLLARSRVDVPDYVDRVEVRYRINGKKFRLVTDATANIPYSIGFPRSDLFAFVMETGEDVTDRVKKYMGPWGDAHGMQKIPLAWFYPSHEEDDLPETVCIRTGNSLQKVTEDDPFVVPRGQR